jgi:hypothetical protein
MKKYIWIALISVSILSCGRKKNCEIGGLDLKISNFTPDENDTLTIVYYKKGDGFSEVVHTNTIIFNDSLDSINGIINNTIVLSNWKTRVGHIGYLRGHYDYKVITKSNAYFFSEMYAPHKSQTCSIFPGCQLCISSITRFKLNGELFDKSDTEPIELVH